MLMPKKGPFNSAPRSSTGKSVSHGTPSGKPSVADHTAPLDPDSSSIRSSGASVRNRTMPGGTAAARTALVTDVRRNERGEIVLAAECEPTPARLQWRHGVCQNGI
jgi:hypothetical protein